MLNRPLLFSLSAVIVIVLGTQGVVWVRMNHALAQAIAERPSTCSSVGDIEGVRETALDYFTIPLKSILMQGRTPTRIVLTRGQCESDHTRGFSPFPNRFQPWDHPGWFDLSVLEGRVAFAAYEHYLHRLEAQTGTTDNVPAPEAMAQYGWTWFHDNPVFNVQVRPITQWGIEANAVRFHPYFDGIGEQTPTSLLAYLPASTSGRSLLFLATLAESTPLQRNVDGTDMVFRIRDSMLELKRTTVNNLSSENWVPIEVTLPEFESAQVLDVTIEPRSSTAYDGTYISFVGVLD